MIFNSWFQLHLAARARLAVLDSQVHLLEASPVPNPPWSFDLLRTNDDTAATIETVDASTPARPTTNSVSPAVDDLGACGTVLLTLWESEFGMLCQRKLAMIDHCLVRLSLEKAACSPGFGSQHQRDERMSQSCVTIESRLLRLKTLYCKLHQDNIVYYKKKVMEQVRQTTAIPAVQQQQPLPIIDYHISCAASNDTTSANRSSVVNVPLAQHLNRWIGKQ